jgi:hypothetical protein
MIVKELTDTTTVLELTLDECEALQECIGVTMNAISETDLQSFTGLDRAELTTLRTQLREVVIKMRKANDSTGE